MQQLSGIAEACDIVGGQTALGDKLGVTQQAVSLWVHKGYAPQDRVPEIAELTGIDRKRLCDPRILALLEP